MRFRYGLATVAALASLLGIQSVCFAGAASRGITVQGKVKFFGSRHFSLKQPAPVQAVPTVNVRDFGATGNGVTDDTAAIQNAINSARATGQGVFFPAGTYLHNNVITAHSVSLTGVGGGTTLLANNPAATAVILTGASPSIQNMVVSSALAGNGLQSFVPQSATLLIQNAVDFVVQGITVVQATGRVGIFAQQSAIGNVSAVTVDGTGSVFDWGIVMDGCNNVSLLGNLIFNEGRAMIIGGVNFIPPPFNGNFNPQSIAIEGNSIFSGSGDGMDITNVNVLDVESNQIQTGGSGTPINVLNCIGYFVANNVTSGGSVGIRLIGTLPTSTGSIVQNTFRNCGAAAIAVTLTVPIQGTIQLVGNQFGECGLSQLTSVIGIGGASGPDSLQLINNVYFGHVNALNSFIVSSFHMNVVNGNYQTQTTLPNFLP